MRFKARGPVSMPRSVEWVTILRRVNHLDAELAI